MSIAFDMALTFALFLVGFGIFAIFAWIVERFIVWWDRTKGPELLPPPNPRTVIRRRGWQVPF